MSRIAASAFWALMLCACVPPSAFGQGSSCLADAQGDEGWLLEVRRIYAAADSASLISAGHPWAREASITTVTSSAVCDLAVTAHNRDRGIAGTTSARVAVLVFSIGSTGYVVVDPDEIIDSINVFRIYTPNWDILQTLMG